MSRIGKQPVAIPGGVTVTVKDGFIAAKGPKGEVRRPVLSDIAVAVENNRVTFKCLNDSTVSNTHHGTMRSHVANMVAGAATGYQKTLLIEGVGYRAQVQGQSLTLAVGKSHPIVYDVPAGVKVAVEQNTKIVLTSADKDLIGETAAEIRAFHPPEPYRGKGVRYDSEHVRRKAGKSVAAGK